MIANCTWFRDQIVKVINYNIMRTPLINMMKIIRKIMDGIRILSIIFTWVNPFGSREEQTFEQYNLVIIGCANKCNRVNHFF